MTEFLGRERYARGQRARAGMCNGSGDTTVKTTAGAVDLKRPKVRGTLERFSSRLLGKHVTRTNALESLVISGWVRGLSDRDIEAALREALGDDATVSKLTVSRICEQIKDEFGKWRTRDLSEVSIDYLFVDASHFKMHGGARSEPVLAAYGITCEGNPVFLHLDGVSAESTDACVAFLEDMVARGLSSPVLTISDGSPGLCAALDQVFPAARRQRCLIHRAWRAGGARGAPSRQAVRSHLGQGVSRRGHRRDRHPRRVRRSPALPAGPLAQGAPLQPHIERTFGETRRRVRVIGRLPGERSALSLLWAVLDRAAGGWRGITYTPADVRLLQMIRRDLGLTTAKKERPEPDPSSDVAYVA